MRLVCLVAAAALTLPNAAPAPTPVGSWKAALDLAGGALRFGMDVRPEKSGWQADICNGPSCEGVSAVQVGGDSVVFEIAAYAATITARLRGDSMVGQYRNVGSRGPRTIPFRAERGRWPSKPGPRALLGRWDATLIQDWQTSPRVFEFRNGSAGLEASVIGNTGDYGMFGGTVEADSFSVAHFDGSFVYLVTGRVDGDTLRGVFHAGLRTQTPWVAVRSTGKRHLTPPTEVTKADTTTAFRFSFPDLEGRTVTNEDARFKGKVVIVDVFGSWCPTCHEAAPELVRLYREHHSQGLEMVGLAYEATGDSSVDSRQVRRYRDKFKIPFPLLMAGISDPDAAAATLPQLRGFTAFPTTIFIGRDGRVRRVHAGFYGPATGRQHERLVAEFGQMIRRLLAESSRS